MKVAVVGAGPAGASAAVQLCKEGLDFRLYERNEVGGLLRYAGSVDNLLGHRGRSGTELCSMIEDHMMKMDIEIFRDEVTGIRRGDGDFIVSSSGGDNKFTHVILASGSTPNRLDIPGVIYYIEDPSYFASKRLLIIGGGDIACDNAVRVKNAGAHVTIMIRKTLSANQGLIRSVMESGIDVIRGDPADVLHRDGSYNLPDGSGFDHCAAFIGRIPKIDLISDFGEIEITHPTGRTSVKGLYVIGDAALGTLSQTALASGMGLAAAMNIARLVRNG